MASLRLVGAWGGSIFLGLIQNAQPQPQHHIIKHTNLLSLRVDNSLATNRLVFWCWWLMCRVGFCGQRLAPYVICQLVNLLANRSLFASHLSPPVRLLIFFVHPRCHTNFEALSLNIEEALLHYHLSVITLTNPDASSKKTRRAYLTE